MKIRRAEKSDAKAISRIYNQAVENSVATFDIVKETANNREGWLMVFGNHYPIFVAIDNNEDVIGWGALTPYDKKLGYNRTVELSIYVDVLHREKGAGKLLTESLIEEGKKVKFHLIISRIAGDNSISEQIHQKFGFEKMGVLKEAGYKFNRYVDVVFYQLLL